MSHLERAHRSSLYVPEQSGAKGFNLGGMDRVLLAEADHDPNTLPPESVARGLWALKPTMHLRYNRKGVVVRESSYDVNGNARRTEYAPRWELWDIDESGNPYQIMVLRTEEGGFREPGEWLVERFRKFNPNNFSSLQDMLDTAYRERKVLAEVEREGQFQEFVDFMADWVWWRLHTVQATETNNPLPRLAP